MKTNICWYYCIDPVRKLIFPGSGQRADGSGHDESGTELTACCLTGVSGAVPILLYFIGPGSYNELHLRRRLRLPSRHFKCGIEAPPPACLSPN